MNTAREFLVSESNKQVDYVKTLLYNIKTRCHQTIDSVEILESMIRSVETLAEEARKNNEALGGK